jgi:TolB protein
MRARVLVAFALSGIAFAVVGARAAERPAVVVTSGKEQKFSVALQKFGGEPDAEAFREGLVAALEFSSLFRLIDRMAFLGPTTTEVLRDRGDLLCSEWTTIGADVFVEGVLRTEQEQFVAEFAVWDLAGCERKLRRRYRQLSTADPLILARRIADDIVEVLTGVRGVSSTELTFVSKRGGNPEIYVMDADGRNQRAATANRSINNFPS